MHHIHWKKKEVEYHEVARKKVSISADFVGTYFHPAYGTIHITENMDTLHFRWGNLKCILSETLENADSFDVACLYPSSVSPLDFQMYFGRGFGGEIDKLTAIGMASGYNMSFSNIDTSPQYSAYPLVKVTEPLYSQLS